MPFLKFKPCASTQLAIDAFQMFRQNTINVRKVWDEDEDGYVLKRVLPTGKYEGEDYPSPEHLEQVVQALSGDYSEVRIHDLERYKADWETTDRRVEFFVESPNENLKTILTIVVRSMYLDGDEVCGQTAWRVAYVHLQYIDRGGYRRPRTSHTEEFHIIRDNRDTPRDDMHRVFGGTLYLVSRQQIAA